MIKINGLEKNFSSFSLKIDELYIEEGERVAVIGPNGSGKSTLLRLIAGIIKPDSGIVKIKENSTVGYEPQTPYCFKCNAEKNIRLGADQNEDIQQIMERCMLSDLKDKPPSKLSGGEKQRMCFARMIAGKYDLLLLDEPMSAADIETTRALEEYLVEVCENGNKTLLISTHLPRQVLNVATKVLILNNGEVSEYCGVSDLKAPKSEFGRKFIDQWRL
ncbi:MAG: ABC transporter ATP-binding protein [Clostridiales bacterium]|nr:ABC transporter ATP-binding protein [Clostridiales bacterium]